VKQQPMENIMKLKLLAFTTTLLISSIIQAGEIIAQYGFTTPIKLGDSYHSVDAFIDEDKNLKLEIYEVFNNRTIGGSSRHVINKTIQLSEAVFSIISNRVDDFAKVEISKRHEQYICMMMPSPMMYKNTLKLNPNDYSTGGPLRTGLKTVMGPHGCWVKVKIAPKLTRDIEKARALKDLIRVIAMEASKEELQ
jgi:hypothetical protein